MNRTNRIQKFVKGLLSESEVSDKNSTIVYGTATSNNLIYMNEQNCHNRSQSTCMSNGSGCVNYGACDLSLNGKHCIYHQKPDFSNMIAQYCDPEIELP